MTIGHALSAITYLSFVCNKYELPPELPDSKTCYMETTKQSNGQLGWTEKCCPGGCVFANCQCMPARQVQGPYMSRRMTLAECKNGIYRRRTNRIVPSPPFSAYNQFSRSGITSSRLGQATNPNRYSGNTIRGQSSRKQQAYRQGNKQISVNDPNRRQFMNSMLYRTYPIRPNRVIYRNGGINNRGQIYNLRSSSGMNGRRIVYTNGRNGNNIINGNYRNNVAFQMTGSNRKPVNGRRIVYVNGRNGNTIINGNYNNNAAIKKESKRKRQYGRYGGQMDNKNFEKFQKNLQAANDETKRLTKEFTKTENIIKDSIRIGAGQTASGRPVSGRISSSDTDSNGNQNTLNFQRTTHQDYLKMKKYGDIYRKTKPSMLDLSNGHPHGHAHGDHDHHNHSHAHGHDHHGHQHGSTFHHHSHHHGPKTHDHTNTLDKGGTGTDKYNVDTKIDTSGSSSVKTAAARKQTIEVVDTSGVGGFTEVRNLNNENSGTFASKTGFVHTHGLSTGTNMRDSTKQTTAGELSVNNKDNHFTSSTTSNGDVLTTNQIDTSSTGVGGGEAILVTNSDGKITSGAGGSINGISVDGPSENDIDSLLTGIGGETIFTGNSNEASNGGTTVTQSSSSKDNLFVVGSNSNTVDIINTNTGSAGTSSGKQGGSGSDRIDVSSVGTDRQRVVIGFGETGSTSSSTGHDTDVKKVNTESTNIVDNSGSTGGTDISSVGSDRKIVIVDTGVSGSSGASTGSDIDISKSENRDSNTIKQTGFTGIITNTNVDITKTVDNTLIENNDIRTNNLITDSSFTGGSSTKDVFVVDNTKDNRATVLKDTAVSSQSSRTASGQRVVDSTFPVIGGVMIDQLGRTAEQRKVEVIQEEELYLTADVCQECEILDGGIGYIYHPKHCDMFIMCIPSMDGRMKPVAQVCPHGQFWDQSSITCRPSQLTICPLGECYTRRELIDNQTYAHRSNCRAYWQCSGGYAHEQCCPDGQSYKSRSGCVPDKTCKEACGHEIEKPYKWIKKCDKKPVTKNPRKYNWEIISGTVVMDCAPGTHFNEELCECIYFNNPIPGTQEPAIEPVCTPEIHLTFDDFMDHSGKNSYVYNNNASLDGKGAACFDGDSAISLPMFTNMHLGSKLYAKIRYRQPFTIDSQALMYNGDCFKKPSLVVTSSTTTNHIEVTSAYGEFSTLDLMSSTPANKWRDVVLHIHGNELNAKSDQDHKSLQVPGGIARTQCGLKLGWGKDYGFVGCIDDFVLYRCFPDKM